MTATKRILVVEDNDFVRMQLTTFLKSAGHEVIEATDGSSAQEKLLENPHMALVDVLMEPVGGFAFIRQLQVMGVDIPVVLVTGDQNNDLLEQAHKLGVKNVLIKPVKKDRLLSMIERIFQREG